MSALIVGAVAAAAPVLVLWDTDCGMGTDYTVHAWMIAYQGEAWKADRAFPPVFNSEGQVGTPLPVFYGGALYKVAGLLSAAWGCHVAVRLLALLSLIALYAVVRHTVRVFGVGEAFSVATACATCWATYPLTNLYSRTAIPEFFAGAMLICSCCLWVQFFFRPGPGVRWHAALAAGLFWALAASTHPITGMLSVPVLGLIYAAHWWVPVVQRPGAVRRHAALFVAGLLACLVMSPWLYAYRRLGAELAIAPRPAVAPVTVEGLQYFGLPTRTAVWVRLFPMPLDYNQMTPGAPPLGTLHLETQASLPLLALAGVALAGAFRAVGPDLRPRLVLVGAAVGAFGLGVFVLSVSPEVEGALPAGLRGALSKIQFAYRLVATVNTVALIGLLLALVFRPATGPSPGGAPWAGPPVALAVVFTLLVCGLSQKAMNGRAVCWQHKLPTDRADPEYARWIKATSCAAGWGYFTPDCAPPLPPHEAARLHLTEFPIGSGEQFGRVGPVRVALAADGYVSTQAVPFRWSAFKVDGVPVPEGQLRTWENPRAGSGAAAARTAVPVPAGAHTIEYAFAPPRKWRVLNAAADWVLVGWAVVVVGLSVPRLPRRAALAAAAPVERPAPVDLRRAA
ncbi:hypothetical protein [Frigoriglobus tundricola]|uniref:hypothetical protein n=1 Tax=Frigoriglobus tundricola TaxID=2774151 RepID=UPI00148EA795|nr:hypothetical protein [Frigoriglobus tundricola]